MADPVVVCVLRSGGDYTPAHVERLYAQVRAPGQFEGHFVVLTDIPLLPPVRFEQRPLLWRWPGWWSKLELCSPEQDQLGDILYFDLDTTILGSIAPLAARGSLTMLEDFEAHGRLASGVMYLPVAARQACWKQLKLLGAEAVMALYHRRGDQGFFASVWGESPCRWQDVLPDQIFSYKKHVQGTGRTPPGARLVCFHGQPRPWDVEPV